MSIVPIDFRTSRSGDIDDHAAALAGWEQRYTQLDGGAFAGQLSHASMPGVALFREETNVKLRQDIVPPRHALVFGVPLTGSGPALIEGHPVGAGDALVITGGIAHEFICRDRMDIAAVVLDLGRAAEWGLEDEAADAAGTRPVVRGPATVGLGAMVLTLLGEIATAAPCLGEAALAGLPAMIAARCLSVVTSSRRDPLPSPGQRYRIVGEARVLVEAAGEEVPAVPVLARKIGVSVRTLEYCFAETLGLSPNAYIRTSRLNGARRDLKSARPGETTVADIAMKWGFWHLGRFSSAYRELFAEAPSETLRRPPGSGG